MKIELGKPVTLVQGDEVAKGNIDGFQREAGGVTLMVFIPDDSPVPPDSGEAS